MSENSASKELLQELSHKTGKPYGGVVKDAVGHVLNIPEMHKHLYPELGGASTCKIYRGDLNDEGRYRFGKLGNIGMRTSFVVNEGPGWIETRNTIYGVEKRSP